MWNMLASSEDQAHQLASCSRMWMVCRPACNPTSPTSESASSELAWARWTVTELFVTDRHQHLPAATMLHVLSPGAAALALH